MKKSVKTGGISLIILVAVDISAEFSRKQPYVGGYGYEKLSLQSDRNYNRVRAFSSIHRKAKTLRAL
jgi:hypothetical protein